MRIRHLAAAAALFVVLLPLNGWAEDKLSFSGDFRGRGEGFRFSEDETGGKKTRRFRLRYRLRLNAKAMVNEYASFKMRVGTGVSDSRSANITLGGMVDFGPDALGIRRAYFAISPMKQGKFNEDKGKLMFEFGRVPNPFMWKNGEDKMMWDSDIDLTGASALFGHDLGDNGKVFANLGYYALDENSGDKDPELGAFQAGVTGEIAAATAGARATVYRFDHLTPDFIQRGVDGTNVDGSDGATGSGGNIQDGLTGNPLGGQMNVVEGQGFVKMLEDGEWPFVLFGGGSHNASAKASVATPDAGPSANAFNFGAQAGNKNKVVQVGASYYHIEANAFPSQFIDSDILEGVTNRKGVVAFVSKNITKSTDFKVTGLYSDAIETSAGYGDSIKNSERTRYQFDLVVKF